MKQLKYLLLALGNLLFGSFLFTVLISANSQLNSFFLTALFLVLLGASGLITIIKVRNQEVEEAQESLGSWYSLTKSVDIILVLALLIRIFVFQPFIVEGQSMEPNFHDKEFLIVDRMSYKIREPKRGEVVVFRVPSESNNLNYIKRIIGLPGETVEIKNGGVYVNNRLVEEPYLDQRFTTTEDTANNELTRTLGSDEYFVMGDNRSNSSDSRIIGPVEKSRFIGRAYMVMLPVKYFSLVKHESYSF